MSITSPILELISIYSTTNDEALGVLLSLSVVADGAVQSAISSSLRHVYESKPERLIAIVNSMKLDLNEVLLLMEDE